MRILIFTEGTLLMHKHGKGHPREEIVQQVRDKEASVHDYASYIPLYNAVEKLITWKKAAEIVYLTSRRKDSEIEDIKCVLKKYHFPAGRLVFRKQSEDYKDVAERVVPDILIEDDCESIGGKNEMAFTHVKPSLKKRIISVVVREFEGIDCLEDDVTKFAKRFTTNLIPIDSLYCSQDKLFEKHIFKKNNNLPIVVSLWDNKYYICDGHNRIAKELLEGKKNVWVEIRTSAIATLAQQERSKLKPFLDVFEKNRKKFTQIPSANSEG